MIFSFIAYNTFFKIFTISHTFIILIICLFVKLNYYIYNDESEKVLNSSNIFKTEELYETMSNYAEELLMKSEIYNEQYIEQLFENNKELFKSIIEVKKLIFGEPLSEDEMLNVSLGKLKMDLLKQIKVYDT